MLGDAQIASAGRMQTDLDNTNPVVKGEHSHFPSIEDVRARALISAMKERCKEEPTPIPVIYKRETANSAEKGIY